MASALKEQHGSLNGTKRSYSYSRILEFYDLQYDLKKNKKRQKSSRVNLATTSIRTLPLLFFLETARTSSNERARLRKWLGNLGFRYCDVFDDVPLTSLFLCC